MEASESKAVVPICVTGEIVDVHPKVKLYGFDSSEERFVEVKIRIAGHDAEQIGRLAGCLKMEMAIAFVPVDVIKLKDGAMSIGIVPPLPDTLVDTAGPEKATVIADGYA